MKDILVLELIFVFATLFCSPAAVGGQRTFMRTCECEYVTNGKCAYTLLLPIGDAASTCPGQSKVTDVPNGGDSSSLVRSLEDQVSVLHNNMTMLSDWSVTQARLLAQLQGAIIQLQNSAATSPPATGAPASTPAAGVPASPGTAPGDSNGLLGVVMKLDALSANVKDVSTTVLQFQNRVTGLESTVQGLQRSLTSTQDDVRTLQTEVRQLRGASCRRRGLLVSGRSAAIPDENINSSSTYNLAHSSDKVRINNTARPGAWCPKEPNTNYEWVQFDLGTPRRIYGTVLKGRFDFSQWVTAYRVEYVTSGLSASWTNVTDIMGEPEVFQGNVDKNTAKVNLFWEHVVASSVRIVPLQGLNKANKCMRADVIGCIDDIS